MHPFGVLKVFTFLSAWLAGCAIVPMALVGVLFKMYLPLYALLTYCGFTMLFPPRRWDYMRSMLCLDGTPYFNSLETVFDDGADVPKPDSKVMFTVGPHGILTLGWGYLNTCTRFIKGEIKWLVAPMLLYLPIARDVM